MTGGGALAMAVACPCVAEPREARRTRDDEAERRTPHDRAIEGPAVYPMNAPATAPTGPSTTAPDSAPSAASPARSWAFASNEKDIIAPAIRAASSGWFIVVSPNVSRRDATPELRRQRGTGLHSPAHFLGSRTKTPATDFSGRAFQQCRYPADLPDVSNRGGHIGGTKFLLPRLLGRGRHPPFITAPVADSQRSSDPLFKTSARADSQRWRLPQDLASD